MAKNKVSPRVRGPQQNTSIVKVPKAEVVFPAPVAETGPQMLKRLVAEQVEGILSERDGLMLEPWFRSRSVSNEILRLQKVSDRHKWTRYYQKFGCLVCGDRLRGHAGCGFDQICYGRIRARLGSIAAELFDEFGKANTDFKRLLRGVEL